MKTIYCPACGELCRVLEADGIEQVVRCPVGHQWAITVNDNDPRSKDGTSLLGFQCDGTATHELPAAPQVVTYPRDSG